MITLEEFKNHGDFQQCFGCPDPVIGSKDSDLERLRAPLLISEVAKLYGVHDDPGDGNSWSGCAYGKMSDGRYFKVSGWSAQTF